MDNQKQKNKTKIDEVQQTLYFIGTPYVYMAGAGTSRAIFGVNHIPAAPVTHRDVSSDRSAIKNTTLPGKNSAAALSSLFFHGS